MISFEEELYVGKQEFIVVKGTWSPSRPAPACSDHDDPRFSDSGDDAEIDIQTINDSTELVDELSQSDLREIEERLLEILESTYYG